MGKHFDIAYGFYGANAPALIPISVAPATIKDWAQERLLEHSHSQRRNDMHENCSMPRG